MIPGFDPQIGILDIVTKKVHGPTSNGLHSAVPPTEKRVLLLKPRGFCAGVVRAIDVVKIALDTFGAPIYVRREIVHNRYVVNELAEKGAIFVHEIDDVPVGHLLGPRRFARGAPNQQGTPPARH
jgi:4-hydroxy-3-methylbut-2-enyl diphosphate reductase